MNQLNSHHIKNLQKQIYKNVESQFKRGWGKSESWTLKKTILNKLCKHLRDVEYSEKYEHMVGMLISVLHFKAYSKFRDSATKAVLGKATSPIEPPIERIQWNC